MCVCVGGGVRGVWTNASLWIENIFNTSLREHTHKNGLQFGIAQIRGIPLVKFGNQGALFPQLSIDVPNINTTYVCMIKENPMNFRKMTHNNPVVSLSKTK